MCQKDLCEGKKTKTLGQDFLYIFLFYFEIWYYWE